jgi:hypothetical protein
MPEANKNKPKPKAKLYFGNADELAKTNNYLTPEYLQEVDKRRNDWNEFVQFLKKENVAGSENLDKSGAGLGYLKKWNKANPDKAFTQEDIKDVQYFSRNTKKQTGERVNDGILGKVTSTFTFPDSKVNTYEMKDGKKVLVKSEEPNIGNYQYQADKINFGIAAKNKADVSKLPIYNKNSATTNIDWDKNDATASNLLKEQTKKRSLSGQSLSKPEQFVKPLVATENHPAVQEQLEGSYFDNNQKVVDYNTNLQQQKQAEVQQQADTRTALQKKLDTSKGKDFSKEEALDYFNETGKVLPQNKVQGKYSRNKENQILDANNNPYKVTSEYKTPFKIKIKNFGKNTRDEVSDALLDIKNIGKPGRDLYGNPTKGYSLFQFAKVPLNLLEATAAPVKGLIKSTEIQLPKKRNVTKVNEEFDMPTFQEDAPNLTQKRKGGLIGKYQRGGEIKRPVFPGKLDNRVVSDNTSVQRPTIQQQDVRLKTPQEVKKANRENFQKRIGVKPTYNVQELTDFNTPEPGLQDASLEALDALSLASGVGYLGKKGLQVGANYLGNRYLPNAYKYNPLAERLNNANKSYRVAGLDAGEDFKNTGVLRSVTPSIPKGASLLERAQNRPTSFPSFQKGYADMRYLPEEGGVVFETSLPTFKRGDINPVTGFPVKGRHYAHRVIDPETGAIMTEIPGADIKMFGDKPHWLQGYKPITFKEGGVIKDNRGQWAHPGEITEIGSNNITMQGVNYPVLGVSDQGDTQMMYPEQNYQFRGNKVTEYPMMQRGGKVKPIVVTNPNDPRLKAYNDSSALYNSSVNLKNTLDKLGYYQNENAYNPDFQTSYGKEEFISGIKREPYINDTTNVNILNYPHGYNLAGGNAYDPRIPNVLGHNKILPIKTEAYLPNTDYGSNYQSVDNGLFRGSDGVVRTFKEVLNNPNLYSGNTKTGEIVKESPLKNRVTLPIYQKPVNEVVLKDNTYGKYYGNHNSGTNGYYYMNHKTGKMYSPLEYKKLMESNTQQPVKKQFEEGGTLQENNNMEYGKGGYTVKRSSDRKGKTHVVIGPDGTKKYFGDPNLGERGKSKYGKEAFYARHKKNLDANPYFRAYARATWEDGGMIPEQGHITMNKRSLFKYGGLTVTDLNKYQDGGAKSAAGSATKTATSNGSGSPTPSPTGANVSGSAIGAGIGFGAEMIGGLIPEKQYSDEEGNDLGSVKSIGESTLEYGAKGAAVTAALGGMDFGIATALGAGYGAVKGWMDKEEMEEKQKEANFKSGQRRLSKRMNVAENFGNSNVNTSQEMQFAQGGMVLDYNDPNANAELELQETFQMPNGQVGMVDGPSHENGGIAVDLPEGTRIWSDKLKYGGKTFAKHTKPITSKIARLEKEIEKDPTKSKAKQNSVMLLNQQLDHYFDVQETNKEANEMKRTFKNGGMIKRADGSYSRRGLWDNIRANKGSGKKPTPQMLEQERKINNEMAMGGYMYGNGGMLRKYQMAGEVGNPYDPFNQPNEYASWANQNKPIVANTLADVKPFTPRVTADQINKTAGMNVVTPIDQVVPQLGSSANPYEMEVDTTETGAPGFFNNAGQFIQNNPGLIGQLGTAAITAGAQMNRVNKLARPRTLGDVRLTDKVINPNLVDYSAERQAYNRMGLNAMGEAQRGFGSSAAAQAFKNKARLNTLEGTGKSYQSQENTNAQIRNAANMARQEAAMKEAMMNSDISKYNLENVYGYDTMTTAQKNAITAMLGNTAGQTFGKQSDYANQLQKANILANQYDPSVLNDMIKNGKLKVVDGQIVKARNGGTIKKRSLKK